jgi:MoaA/NifB/PqqE/SkfB family radical SAM enzyme
MLANKKIFCNTPWYEIHIYWDGSFGICCQESHKLYPESTTEYNVKTMSIMDWFNSEPARKFRNKILLDQPASECSRCYIEENNNGNSRRLKSNQKSVIFTRTAFESSFLQSPGYRHFKHSVDNQGQTTTYPIDLHIDLGNFCNLACKMCNARASSTIASQHVRWGIESDRKYLGVDWTRDPKVWHNFKQQLLAIPGLNNIHFMGGETILTDRFEDLVDTLIENKRFELCLSFVTNGTVFKSELMNKLKHFKRVGIEISIETVDDKNSYVRQGTDTQKVLENIQQYQTHCNNTTITVTLRPAPSALSIGGYLGLLQFSLDKKLLVKSNICFNPRFLNIDVLPDSVKQNYLNQYLKFIKQFDNVSANSDYNASDPNNYAMVIKEQALMCVELLQAMAPKDADQQLKELVEHCRRWDNVYKLNAREVYPELESVWNQYGY